jgi:hypothetical protein
MSHRPSKEAVQVCIEGKKIQSSSNTPSFVVRVHEPHFTCIKAESKMNFDAVCITLSKSKEPGKLLKSDLIPHSLGHPMKFSCVPPPLLNIQSGKELSDDLIIPILLESHKLSQMLGSTSTHNFIKNPVTLALHVTLIHSL